MLGRDWAHHRQLHLVLEVDDLPPLACFGEQLVGHRREAAPDAGSEQQLGPRLVDDQRDDLCGRVDVERVADRLAEAARAGQLVGTDGEEPAIVGGEQQLVGGLRVDRESRAVAFLELEVAVERNMAPGRADPPALREDHRDRLLLDHRVHAELDGRRRLGDRRAAAAERGVFGVVLADRGQVALEPCALARGRGEQLLELVLLLQQLVLLLAELHFLELAQAAQPHVEDRLCLTVGEPELGHHHRLGLVLGADDLDHPVEVEERDDVAFDQLEPVGDLLQPVAAAALQDVDLVRDPVRQQLVKAHHHRRARGVEHVEVEPEARLEIGELVERFLEQLGVDVAALGHEDDADVLVALVAHVLEDRQLAIGDELRDLLDQPAFRHPIGHFRDHQLVLPAAEAFDARIAIGLVLRFGGMEPPAHAETAAPALVRRGDRLGGVHHQSAGREVGPAEQLHQPRVLDVRVVDQLERGVDHFGDVVAGDARRHADRDPARPVRQEVWEQPGKDRGLFLFVVVGRDEVDGAFVEPLHQLHRRLGQAALGVAFGRGVIAIDVAEVALPLDQRVAQRERLREAHHRIVEREVAVRMVLAHHVADHAAGLLERAARIEPQPAHAPQDAAVDRLEPVAQVRQRTRRDRGQRIDQVPFAQRAVEGRVDNRVERVLLVFDDIHAARPSSGTAGGTARNGRVSTPVRGTSATPEHRRPLCPDA